MRKRNRFSFCLSACSSCGLLLAFGGLKNGSWQLFALITLGGMKMTCGRYNAGEILSLGSPLENVEDHDLDDEDGWCHIAFRKIGLTPGFLFGCLIHLWQAQR